MKIINTHTFKHTLRDIHKNTENRKFCFIVGAGASRKSGIPTGGELAENWFSEIKARLENNELEHWIKDKKIDINDLGASYGSIYRKRFENDKTSGYEFLVQAMKNTIPSLGHIVLAQILCRTSGHCVLTTNFDSLIESSVYQFTNKTPLVCGHESLSGYARPSQTHPLIIKVHRDLLLEPKSDPDEINELAQGWKEPLDHIFSTHIPIVIGYGGNDGSLMDYFEKMSKPSNFFWCGLSEDTLSLRIKKLIENRDGSFVKIEGFDEFMHELLWVFDEIKPIKDELNEITNERILIANKQFDEVTKKLNVVPSISIAALNKKELSALEYSDLAKKEPNLEKRKQIYFQALDKYSLTGWLWWEFTYFLHFIKFDYDNLDSYYEKALELNRNQSGIICNYAMFLQNIKKDFDKADEYYLKAISAEPNNANTMGIYAVFLKEIKKDYKKAEDYFLKALNIDPNSANINNNYANFLAKIKDNNKAREYYLKALSIDPNNSDINTNYACFIKEIDKDYATAMSFYLKTLNINPNHANANGNYAQILLELGKIEDAMQYIQRAFDNNNEENSLSIELWFYKYAHFKTSMNDSKVKIEELLAKGIRSSEWNFSGNVTRAIKDGHPNPKELEDIAKRITSTIFSDQPV